MRKEAFDRLANIQTHVQAVLTQPYELNEYPIPIKVTTRCSSKDVLNSIQVMLFAMGVSAVGVVVPTLDSLMIDESMKAIQACLELTNVTMRTLVDESISFLQGLQSNPSNDIDITNQNEPE
ncbi:hypothetical protein BGZ76_005026 [Entomortierella beljakovae]|nr:hypothetical protein BGZ76_005026 [Entomortierella beljakovae]